MVMNMPFTLMAVQQGGFGDVAGEVEADDVGEFFVRVYLDFCEHPIVQSLLYSLL